MREEKMSEFPEWLEQRWIKKYGIFWDPSYEQSKIIHKRLQSGELRPNKWESFKEWFYGKFRVRI